MSIMAIYTLYILFRIYISVMQIGFINRAKRQQAVLLKTAEYMQAAKYAVAKEKLSIVGTFVEYLLFVFWMGKGMVWLDTLFLIQDELYKAVAVVLSFIIIGGIVSLPLEWYQKFVLDEAFGFNRSSYGQYIKDTIISTLLTLVLGGVVIYIVAAIMVSSELWWLWSFLFIFGVIVLLNMFFPTLRAMFFDKLSPLDDEELNQKIAELMDKTGFKSSGVFISDASKRDARLNAYFGGLGKTKRVVLFDTLLKKLSHEELLAVLGHELGHFAHGDIYKNIAVMGGMLFVMFAIFGNIPESLYLELGISSAPHIVMMLFMLLMSMLSFVMMPLMGIISRHNEFEADRTGAELGGQHNLVSALTKLVTENKSFPLSHPLYIFFYYTHPPVLERFKELGVDIYTGEKSALEGTCPPQDV
jgi:STE24 endopeptidase